MKPNKIFLLLLTVCFVACPTIQAQSSHPLPWVKNLPIPQNESIYLVVKGLYHRRESAEAMQGFIQQLMGKTPADGVDVTDKYMGLPKGKYFIGMLFDSRERAQWWINLSFRNRKVPRGQIRRVQVKGISYLPYMPDALRAGMKRLLTVQEAIERVKGLSDVRVLSLTKKLKYKITDYPRNGDLRYEVEILEDKGLRRDGVMVDFVMVSALDGRITERLSTALKQGRRGMR